MKAVVDRIEEKTAVLLFENHGLFVNMPLILLPPGTKEGDWLKVQFLSDEDQTTSMYARNKKLLDKLSNKSLK